MKICKIINAEFKKMLSKTGIFILCAFLALILVFSSLTYSPSVRYDDYIYISGTTVTEIYDKFNESNEFKTSYDETILSSYTYLNIFSDEVSINDDFNEYIEEIETNIIKYRVNNDFLNNDALNLIRNDIYNLIDDFVALFYNYVKSSYEGNYQILIEEDDYNSFISTTTKFKNIFKNDLLNSDAHYASANNNLISDYFSTIDTIINDKIIYVNIDSELISYLQVDVYEEIKTTQTLIIKEIESIILNTEDEESLTAISKIKELTKSYYQYSSLYSEFVTYSILVNMFDGLDSLYISTLLYFSEYDDYSSKEYLTKLNYYIDTDTFDTDYANAIAFGTSSNYDSENAYDFIYYTLELFSFIIILYLMFVAGGMIAGEQSNGTLKMYAVKPISRKKIYYGKLFSLTIMALILTIFSSIITSIVGGFLYSFDSLSVLLVFNATYAFTLSPIIYMLIYILCLFIKIFVYICLFMMLSAILKNGTLAVMFSMVIYFITIITATLVPSNILLWYPLANITLIPFFGNNTFTVTNNIMTNIFASILTPYSSLIVTGISILVCILIFNFIAVKVFKKRDIA